MGSFDKLKYELVREEAHWGSWCAKPQAYFRGETSMPGAKYHVGFQVFTDDVWMEEAHFHPAAEEYICIYGASLPNVFDFDARVEIDIGEDRDNMETLIIDKPTVLRIPAHFWHCPIHFHINKPLVFQATYLDGTWAKVVRDKQNPDGTWKYVYQGDNVRYCRFEAGKRCTLCGKCFGKASENGYNPEDHK